MRLSSHPQSQEEATASRAPGRRLGEIQGLRAIAILLVVAYHAELPISGGFVGVDVFFVISGFVITRLLMREAADSGRISFARFYGRRVRRLLPALSLMLVVVITASMLIQSPVEAQRDTAIAAAGAATWLANLALFYVTTDYFALDVQPPLLHTWSLAVEEQFYLVFPLLILVTIALARRSGRSGASSRRLVAVAVAASLMVSLAIDIWLCFFPPAWIPVPTGVAFFFPMSRAWEFAAGALIALIGPSRAIARKRLAGPLCVAGTALVAGAAFVLDERSVFPGWVAIVPVAGTVLLIAGCTSGPTLVGRALASAPMRWIGDISYSWYLWHWPFIIFAALLWGDASWIAVLAALASLPVASASYRWVEQPIREGRLWGWSAPRLTAACVAVPLTLAVVLGLGSATSWGNRAIAEMADQVNPKTLGGRVCQNLLPVPERDLETCTFPGDPAASPVVLMGDSNAGQYSSGVVAAGQETGRTVILATAPGCSMNLVEVHTRGQDQGCLPLAESGLEWVATQDAPLVIVASANLFVEDRQFALRDPHDGALVWEAAAKQKIWQQSLTATYRRLQEAGATVVQVDAMPHFIDDGLVWRPSMCLMPEMLADIGRCGERMSLEAGDRMHARGLAAEAAAASAAGVERLDLRPQICPEGICSTNLGNLWVYREGMHLTVGMSERLAPQFVQVIRSVG